ncbi:MAG: DNA mismatch repair protein MutS [Geminicoccaceae bacterium]
MSNMATDATPTAGQDEPASPMIAQFKAMKAAHPGTLLFFRMGDFYELFFDDAARAAPALDIALTKRGRHAGQDIPMCGVPAHNAEPYLHKLIRAGFKVAVCEQTEDPAEARRRGGKPLVRRGVVRIVTPGTLTEEALLEARRNNYLAALAVVDRDVALAWADVSTGEFGTEASTAEGLGPALARLAPGEVLIPDGLDREPEWRAVVGALPTVTPLPPAAFDRQAAGRKLAATFGPVAAESFAYFGPAEIAAAGAVLDYLTSTQKGVLPRLAPPRRLEPSSVMQIDAATRRNLELASGPTGGREGSLLAAVDRTVTSPGARLLAARLAAPLTDPARIRRRHDQVELLVDDPALRQDVREVLRRCPDLERALSRLALGRGGPRDLAAVARGLRCAEALRRRLGELPALATISERLSGAPELAERIEAALVDEPPHLARDGGFVRQGAEPEIDDVRQLRDDSRRHVVALEERYRRETGIGTLKIRHNNLIGYYVEVASNQLSRVPQGFVQRQSMAGATRFSTNELADLESRIAGAADRVLALELELFERLRTGVLELADPVAATARALAALDVAAGLAELAVDCRYVRPEITSGREFEVVGGRHPVVEQALARKAEAFVANDCDLGEMQSLWLLTGPNMAGKSTFLRQNALLAVLAQTGSFVPATSAKIGVVDRLFSRVGAADDLARGHSTFMVEMVETATILNRAGPRSLVILDEIGRGTATHDGLSLAWAVIEHLHEVNRCRALFATHYHELTALAAKLPRLSCHTLRVKEWRGEVVFLHEIAPGTADRSYGIHVARLAGLPASVIRRAQEVLKRLEESEARAAPARLAEDLPLFAAAPSPDVEPEPAEVHPLEATLRDVRPDELSPREALALVYRLKELTLSSDPGPETSR